MAPLTQLCWKSCCWTKHYLAFAIQKIGHRRKFNKPLLIRPSAPDQLKTQSRITNGTISVGKVAKQIIIPT